MISLKELSSKLLNEKSVAIICHVRPDGDTLGSAFALSAALKSLGINAVVACDDLLPSRFLFLNDIKELKNNIDGEFSALIAIDCADITRLGNFETIFLKHKNTYNIDHHVSNTRYAKINYVVDSASNCENVLAILKEMKVEVTEDIANLLMLGIITDTGCFRHKNVQSETLYSAADLKEFGADINTIYYHTFSKQSKQRAALFGKVMSKIRYFLDDRLAVATVTMEDIAQCSASPSDTEGFIDFLTGIEGVEVSVCILETENNKYKISFRSKTADVGAVAAMFGGGGHVLASGCQLFGDYEDVVDRVRFAVSREIPD